jgi:hypothetical protein
MGANAQIAVPAFTAGQVLTATQQTQINTGIPVFATTVTRDAAFGGTGEKTLAEGQFAYIEATNTTQYYDGSAWVSVGTTPGLVPITPTSVAVGSGTGSSSGNGLVTFSGVSSVSLNGVFSSTYNSYRIVLVPTTASTTGINVTCRLRAAGTDNSTASSYLTQSIYGTSTSALASQDIQAQWYIIDSYKTADQAQAAAIIEMYKPNQAVVTTQITNMYFSGLSAQRAGYQTATTQFDGFTISASTGTIGGTISVYGYTL